MKQLNWLKNIDWKSKFMDLLIVIIGITIAFQLDSLNESNKSGQKEIDYLNNFRTETLDNETNLRLALEMSTSYMNDLDTLKHLLLSGQYEDKRILNLSAGMMALSDVQPSVITMENIIASGEFELISDIECRESIISTYNRYETTDKLEGLMNNYVVNYVTPFFFENIRFSDFSSLGENFTEKVALENIVIGYEVMLAQKITGYESNLEQVSILSSLLGKNETGQKSID